MTDFEWNSKLAYAVGLITTDGCLSSDKRHIILTSTDKQLLKTFRDCLNKKNIISLNTKSNISKKTAYRIQIGDVKLFRWLIKIGLHPNKSLSLNSMHIIDRYFPDFLRGHLDGDGSIIYYIDKYNTYLNPKYVYKRIFVYFRSGSINHIHWLRENISRLKQVKGSLNELSPKTQLGKFPNYLLKYSTKEAITLLNWIYYEPNLPCLLRKYKIAERFIN